MLQLMQCAMNAEAINALSKSDDLCQWGIIVSAVIIFGSLLPNVTYGEFSLEFPDSVATALSGLFLLFFTLSIKTNITEYLDD